MNLITIRHTIALFFIVIFAAGCATTSSDVPEPETPSDQELTQDSTATEGIESGQLSEEELALQREQDELEAKAAEMATLREVRVFYFDFDKSTIMPEARQYIQAHAEYLQQNPAVSIVLNGYADERGTKEYNLALGERRAISVRDFLEVNGARRSQIEVVSFGEEFPADPGHNEAAWALNRRVVLEY